MRKILSVDEVNCIGIDDSRVIVLALDFEIVRDQVDRSLWNKSSVGLEWLTTKAAATARATATVMSAAAVSPPVVGRATLVVIMSAAGVLSLVVGIVGMDSLTCCVLVSL